MASFGCWLGLYYLFAFPTPYHPSRSLKKLSCTTPPMPPFMVTEGAQGCADVLRGCCLPPPPPNRGEPPASTHRCFLCAFLLPVFFFFFFFPCSAWLPQQVVKGPAKLFHTQLKNTGGQGSLGIWVTPEGRTVDTSLALPECGHTLSPGCHTAVLQPQVLGHQSGLRE